MPFRLQLKMPSKIEILSKNSPNGKTDGYRMKEYGAQVGLLHHHKENAVEPEKEKQPPSMLVHKGFKNGYYME